MLKHYEPLGQNNFIMVLRLIANKEYKCEIHYSINRLQTLMVINSNRQVPYVIWSKSYINNLVGIFLNTENRTCIRHGLLKKTKVLLMKFIMMKV